VKPSVPARLQNLPALTGLRFLLALWVILHHLTGHGDSLEAAALQLPHPIYTLIRGGYQAVTTFFVLSGFVLARTYARTVWNRGSLFRYGVGRVARVYPVYVLSLLIMAPFILADRTPGKLPLLAAHVVLIQGWIGPLSVNWNTPAWTLSCEMFFYMIFPLAAILLIGSGWRKTLLVGALACCLTRMMWAMGISDDVKPLVHLADFLMGIVASCAYDLLVAREKPPAGAWLYWMAGLAGAAVIAWPDVLPHWIDLNSALRPLNATLLVGLGLGGGWAARALSSRVLIYLGKSSYAMYILHVPLMWWYSREAKEFHAAVYLALVIGVSALVYGLIEEPANRYLRSRASRRTAPQAAQKV
jgi:peptidoglycan/LPS O-acetylase OafA/YrhL